MKQPVKIDCEFGHAVPWQAAIDYAEGHVGDKGVEPNEGWQPDQPSLPGMSELDRARQFAAMRAAVELANLEFAREQMEWNEMLAGGPGK